MGEVSFFSGSWAPVVYLTLLVGGDFNIDLEKVRGVQDILEGTGLHDMVVDGGGDPGEGLWRNGSGSVSFLDYILVPGRLKVS